MISGAGKNYTTLKFTDWRQVAYRKETGCNQTGNLITLTFVGTSVYPL